MTGISRKGQRGFSIVAVIASLAFGLVVGMIGYFSIESTMGEAAYAVDVREWMQEQEEPDPHRMPPYSDGFLYRLLALLVFLDVAAGFIAGRMGRDAPLMHAAAAGLLLVVIGLLLEPAAGANPFPSWYNTLGYLLTVPLFMLGGWMASKG